MSASIRAMAVGAVSTSVTLVNFYEITRRNSSEDSHFHTRRRENLKSKKKINVREKITLLHPKMHHASNKCILLITLRKLVW
jgi:hypothetical protein